MLRAANTDAVWADDPESPLPCPPCHLLLYPNPFGFARLPKPSSEEIYGPYPLGGTIIQHIEDRSSRDTADYQVHRTYDRSQVGIYLQTIDFSSTGVDRVNRAFETGGGQSPHPERTHFEWIGRGTNHSNGTRIEDALKFIESLPG
jgi:hypothetical protein